MLRPRVIPTLLVHGKSLVKTERFRDFRYIGDPVNTVRIFNELEVDELCFLDIGAARTRSGPNFDMLRDIASECFMPLSYGGGIENLETAKKIYSIGFEKIIINSAAFKNPDLISQIAKLFGSQSLVVSIDVKSRKLGGVSVLSHGGTRFQDVPSPCQWARRVEELGAGELLITSIDREGTWRGLDLNLIKNITDTVSIPVIAHGGGSGPDDVRDVVKISNASAVALGSSLVFQKKGMGVLINFPREYHSI